MKKVPIALVVFLSVGDVWFAYGGAKSLLFTTVSRGEMSEITGQRYGVIRDQATWNEYWESLSRNGSQAPRVAFAKEMIVLLHLGSRPSSGYEVEVTSIEDRVSKVVVHYEELIPGPHCMVAQVVTYPYHVVKVQRTDGEPAFDKTDRIRDC